MAYGTGRLFLTATFVEWTGQRVASAARNAGPETRATIRIPLPQLLNLRLRDISASGEPNTSESMLLAEVDGAAIQIGLGEGTFWFRHLDNFKLIVLFATL
jgi:hypothetical protein